MQQIHLPIQKNTPYITYGTYSGGSYHSLSMNAINNSTVEGEFMQSAKFSEIRKQLEIEDDTVYYYAVDNQGTIILRKKTDDFEPGRKDISDADSEDFLENRLDL